MGARRHAPDRGSVLVLTLVVSVVMAMVVVAIATYVSTNLRYARLVEDRADSLATAEGGIEYTVELLRRGYPCGGTIDELPVPTNGASLALRCTPVGAGFAGLDSWAAVITGEGVPAGDAHLKIAEGGSKEIGGRMFMTNPSRIDVSGGSPTPGSGGLAINDGDLFYDGTADDCATQYQLDNGSPPKLASELDERFFLSPDPTMIPLGAIICLSELSWNDVTSEPPIDLPTNVVNQAESNTATPTYYQDISGCRSFEPGVYTQPINWAANNYFRSGNYLFRNVVLQIPTGTNVTVGYPDNVNFAEILEDDSGNPICLGARAADAVATGGATWYLGGSSLIRLQNQTRLEMLPRSHTNAVLDDKYVSVQVLNSGPDASTVLGASEVITVPPGATAEAVFQGRVWAPYQRINFKNVAGGANGQLLGGVVASSLYGDSNPSTSGFKIQADTSPADYRLLVESTATKNGVDVVVNAVVEQRPSASDPKERVAVNSLRVVG